MKFDAWLKLEGLDDAAAADRIGDCSEHAVKKWRYGERIPRADKMRRIQEISGGAVSPPDWYSEPANESPAQGVAA